MYEERNESHFGGNNRGGGFRKSFAPVKVGDELDVKIESVGGQGDGVAKVDGFVLFVPGGKEGDTVRVRVTRVLRKVGFAEIIGEVDGEGQEDQAEESQEEAQEPLEDESEESADEGSEEAEETKQALAEEEPLEEGSEEESSEDSDEQEEKKEE